MNKKALVNNLTQRVAAVGLDNNVTGNSNDNGNGDGNGNGNGGYWKGKKIIPLSEWKKIAYSNGSPSVRLDEGLQYFPDHYSAFLFAFGVPNGYEDKANQWYWDYLQLHEHILFCKYSPEDYKKIIEEANYQYVKKQLPSHDLYYIDQTVQDGQYKNVVKDYGCGHWSNKGKYEGGWCVPECEYYRPCLYPELFSLSEMEIESNGQLLRMLYSLYSSDDDTKNKQSEAHASNFGDMP